MSSWKHRNEGRDEHADKAEGQQHPGESGAHKREVKTEDREEETDQHIDRDLGRRRREKRRHRRRRVSVCVGQPQMHREHGELQPHADKNEGKAGVHHPVVANQPVSLSWRSAMLSVPVA